jgi:tryptophan synthase alpha subunit
MPQIEIPEEKQKLFDFLEEHFVQMQSAYASNGWEYIFLSHRETQSRVVVQIRANESGSFGFELFVPATHSRRPEDKFEKTLKRLEQLADVRRKSLFSDDSDR